MDALTKELMAKARVAKREGMSVITRAYVKAARRANRSVRRVRALPARVADEQFKQVLYGAAYVAPVKYDAEYWERNQA